MVIKVFKRTDDGWTFFQDIRSPDPEPGFWAGLDGFGQRFIVKDNMLCAPAQYYSAHGQIVGANGRVFVYAFDGTQWVYKQALRPLGLPTSPLNPPQDVSTFYAGDLSFDGSRLVVGAQGQWVAGNDRIGLVYVYDRQPDDTFTLEATLSSPSAVQSPGTEWAFGSRTFVNGNRILVTSISDQGKVRLYERDASGWNVTEEFMVPQYPSFWSGEQYYGHSLATYGDRIAIGSLREDALWSSPTDYIRIYKEATPGNWILEQTLYEQGPGMNPSDGPAYGYDMVMEGDWMLVGAKQADPWFDVNQPWQRSGRVFLYHRTDLSGWTLEVDFTHENALIPGVGLGGDNFGTNVSADWKNGRLLINAPGYVGLGPQGTTGLNYFGAVFLYDLEQGTRLCEPESVNLTGSPSGLTVTGSLSIAEDNLLLHAHHLPPGSWATFLYGQAIGPIPMLMGGDLCIGGAFGAHRVIAGNPVQFHGELYHKLDLRSSFALAHMLPGTTWAFQVLHRSYGSQTNTSNAVEVVLEP